MSVPIIQGIINPMSTESPAVARVIEADVCPYVHQVADHEHMWQLIDYRVVPWGDCDKGGEKVKVQKLVYRWMQKVTFMNHHLITSLQGQANRQLIKVWGIDQDNILS